VAPFLVVDDTPYPVIDRGQLVWIVDAYTTTSYYPYAQQANTAQLPSGTGLKQSFNYVRNSVKVVVNAYTGDMTFYAVTDTDPILNTYESIFPHMFKPLSDMDPVLAAHLRYPTALLMVQATMYGRYHLSNPAAFYIANNAWELAPTSGTGSPEQSLPVDAAGNTVRFVPEYELLQLPGASAPGFTVIEPLDPLSQGDRIQTLAALMTASCDYQDYGQLTRVRDADKERDGGSRRRQLEDPVEHEGLPVRDPRRSSWFDRLARHDAYHPDRRFRCVRAAALCELVAEPVSAVDPLHRRLRQ